MKDDRGHEHGVEEHARESAERAIALCGDLVGRAYPAKGMVPHLVADAGGEGRGPLDCYQLLRVVMRRLRGWELPVTSQGALAMRSPLADEVPWPPVLGDILECDGAGEHPAHLVVCLGDGGDAMAIHATSVGGTQMISVAVLKRGGRVRRVLRVRPPAAGSRWAGVGVGAVVRAGVTRAQ